MSSGLDVFDSTLEKSNLILKDIEADLGWETRRNQSYLILRTVLHALRDRLPAEEAVHFSAQLPLLLKGVFFDGWNIEEVPYKMNKEEFVEYIAANFPFDVPMLLPELIRRVSGIIFRHIDEGAARKVISSLPKDIISIVCE